MNLSVSETAKVCGISVRTLHYYDEIGLVKPSEVTQAGYRYYNDDALSRLQQVLFYRELGFSLKEIAHMLQNPDYDRTQALQDHRALLLLKRRHLDDLIKLVDETLGGTSMSKPKTTFADIQSAKEKYADEARKRWGNTSAWRESESHRYSDAQQTAIAEEMDEIFSAFAGKMDKPPSDSAVQALVKRLQEHIIKYHYNCTVQILSGLGEMYVADTRFTESIDRFGDGTAQFINEAIKIYCKP